MVRQNTVVARTYGERGCPHHGGQEIERKGPPITFKGDLFPLARFCQSFHSLPKILPSVQHKHATFPPKP